MTEVERLRADPLYADPVYRAERLRAELMAVGDERDRLRVAMIAERHRMRLALVEVMTVSDLQDKSTGNDSVNLLRCGEIAYAALSDAAAYDAIKEFLDDRT